MKIKNVPELLSTHCSSWCHVDMHLGQSVVILVLPWPWKGHRTAPTPQWFLMTETCRKISSYKFNVISRIFPSKFQQILLISVSDHCFIFKICQTAAGKSMMIFLDLIFGVFFFLSQLWAAILKKTSKTNLRLWLIIVPK